MSTIVIKMMSHKTYLTSNSYHFLNTFLTYWPHVLMSIWYWQCDISRMSTSSLLILCHDIDHIFIFHCYKNYVEVKNENSTFLLRWHEPGCRLGSTTPCNLFKSENKTSLTLIAMPTAITVAPICLVLRALQNVEFLSLDSPSVMMMATCLTSERAPLSLLNRFLLITLDA